MARKRKLPAGLWKRGDVYYARFSAGGRLVRKRLSTDYTVACQLLNDLKARADRAEFDLVDNDCSIEEIKTLWLRHCDQALRSSTVKRYRENLANALDGISARKVTQVSIGAITTYRQDRLHTGSAARTVNMEVGALSTMFNWAVTHRIIGMNPLADVKPLPVDEKRKERRPLALEEVEALFEHSQPHLKPVWRVFMTTGIRKNELVNLLFSDIDFEGRSMTVRASTDKTHKVREIPLDDISLALMVELRDAAKDRQPVPGNTKRQTEQQRANFSREHVFVSRVNTPLKNNLLDRFYTVCGRAGIEGGHPGGSVDIHSLRVSFTTLSLEHGANPKAIQAILGHSTLAMTMNVYAKATGRGKREAVGVLPFAKVSEPAHVLKLDPNKGAKSARESAQVSETPVLPLKNKGEMA